MNKIIPIASIIVACLLISGCDEERNSDHIQQTQQEQLNLQGIQSVGMPAIVNFAEKRHMKDILELRDKDTPTTTYIVDMNNKMRKLCDSVGYGLPYSTQYTNPSRTVTVGQAGIATLPQADPNGLFSPAAAEGTWILCVDPKSKNAVPLYVEPRVIISPFPLGE